MNNLISVFMEYKIKYFVKCTKLLYNNSHRFIVKCMRGYFQTYIDNYYYYTFNTIEGDAQYSLENLKIEFKGIMEEMLFDYREFELIDSNEVYKNNVVAIKELKDICYEIVKLDNLEFENNDELKEKITDFFLKNKLFSKYDNDNIDTLIKYTKDYYSNVKKIFKYEDNNFNIKNYNYENCDNKFFVKLAYKYDKIKSFSRYRKGFVDNVFKKDDRLEFKKLVCLLNKIIYQLLKDTMNNETNYYFVSVTDSIFYKDRIINSIYNLIDNPLFRKYVILCFDFHTYLSHKAAFEDDFQFGCKQDFKRVSDIFKKATSIYEEGVFSYLVVLDCREKEREYFNKFKADGMEVLLIKED